MFWSVEQGRYHEIVSLCWIMSTYSFGMNNAVASYNNLRIRIKITPIQPFLIRRNQWQYYSHGQNTKCNQ